jgi:hypothetical protein
MNVVYYYVQHHFDIMVGPFPSNYITGGIFTTLQYKYTRDNLCMVNISLLKRQQRMYTTLRHSASGHVSCRLQVAQLTLTRKGYTVSTPFNMSILISSRINVVDIIDHSWSIQMPVDPFSIDHYNLE